MITMKAIASIAVMIGAAIAAPALAQTSAEANGSPKKQCFYERNVNGWNQVDDRTVILSVGVKDRYLVKLFAPCPELRHTLTLGLRNRGSDWVCTDDRFDLFIRDSTMSVPRQCSAESMTPITREEAMALTAKKR